MEKDKSRTLTSEFNISDILTRITTAELQPITERAIINGADWRQLKHHWGVLSQKERWISLLVGSLQLRNTLNEVIASEARPFVTTKNELIFRPGKRGFKIRKTQFTNRIVGKFGKLYG